MERKTAISIFMALMMIASILAAGNVLGTPVTPPKGEIDFSKTVWDPELQEPGWDEDRNAELGDTVTFNISLTYYRHPENEQLWKLYDISIKDVLPDCLVFDETISVKSSTGIEPVYSEEIMGNKIYWNFSAIDFKLDDEESLYIEFTATVVGSEEFENQNWAYLDAIECGSYEHCAEDDAWVIVLEDYEPGVDITKYVKDPETEEWVKNAHQYVCWYTLMEPGMFFEFQLNITNTGNVALTDVIVLDELPDFLVYNDSDVMPMAVSPDQQSIAWDLGTIPVGEYRIINFDARIVPLVFLTETFVDGDNWAEVNTSQGVKDEDTAHVSANKRLDLEKEIYDPDTQEWVKSLDYVTLGQKIKFRITGTYYGNDYIMDCALLGDLLPDDCLEYLETTKVVVQGQTLIPGTSQYPYIVPDGGDTILLCGEEVEIPELIGGECPTSYYPILWDFRNAEDFDLTYGQSLMIEFEAEVTNYCECLSTNYAFGIGWGCFMCDPCNYFGDWSSANLSCTPPPTTFDKYVWNGEGWAKEAHYYVGETATFRLEFEYYGNEELTNVVMVDKLPCIFAFDEEDFESNKDTSVEYVVDGYDKTITFTLLENMSDGETWWIEFEVEVTGATGDCPDCRAINKAWLYVYDPCEEILMEFYDEAEVTSEKPDDNVMPCPPIITADVLTGEEGDELTFEAKLVDLDGDDVYYMFAFGEDVTAWIGPVSTGTTESISYTFEEEGTYEVKARAKDTNGNIGEYGNILIVEIEEGEPVEEPEIGFEFPRFGFKSIDVDITNTYEYNFTDAYVEMTVKGGFIKKLNTTINETMNITTDGAAFGMSLPMLPLFGKLTAEITVQHPSLAEDATITANFQKIGPLVLFKGTTE